MLSLTLFVSLILENVSILTNELPNLVAPFWAPHTVAQLVQKLLSLKWQLLQPNYSLCHYLSSVVHNTNTNATKYINFQIYELSNPLPLFLALAAFPKWHLFLKQAGALKSLPYLPSFQLSPGTALANCYAFATFATFTALANCYNASN